MSRPSAKNRILPTPPKGGNRYKKSQAQSKNPSNFKVSLSGETSHDVELDFPAYL